MRERNPEDKKRRLLDAALVVFAASGLAAARVEDIASRAGCSAGLVYTYFGSKEGLFDAVLGDISEHTVAEVPLDASDLAGYAVRLHDAAVRAPEVQRFVSWYQLERPTGRARPSPDPVDEKVAAIRTAQAAGRVRPDIDAAVIAMTVQSIARMWISEPDVVTTAIDPAEDAEWRRAAVHTAVEAFLQAPPR